MNDLISRIFRRILGQGSFSAARRPVRRRAARSRWVRLHVEALEVRLAPATLSAADPMLLSDTAAGNVQGPASVSADGRYVVYTSSAPNLAPQQVTPSTSASNVFLYDRATGATTLVSHAASLTTTAASGSSNNAAISADGNWIAYVSNSDNLVSGETLAGGSNAVLCNQYWVFLYNVQTGANTLVSHLASDQGAGYQTTLSDGTSGILTIPDGSGAGSLASQTNSVSISSDGRYVTYLSTGTHLIVGQQAGAAGELNAANVFVYDTQTDTNLLVSRKWDTSLNNGQGGLSTTTPGNNTSYVAVMSEDGSTIT